jgi:hypothetical protein
MAPPEKGRSIFGPERAARGKHDAISGEKASKLHTRPKPKGRDCAQQRVAAVFKQQRGERAASREAQSGGSQNYPAAKYRNFREQEFSAGSASKGPETYGDAENHLACFEETFQFFLASEDVRHLRRA